ncbi:uncharacterized protein LOC127081619 [Lathyrus oleraceus]|uniref:uncharacterized protein LOC127081619 n=1 Tax=Pisum sativum TaxID=3888 RepID=UPI0021CF2F88|nr:uncharacterized protein LOC127081619 [Pisum sativum]
MVVKDSEIPEPSEGPEPEEQWTLMFDGASNAIGHRIGVVLMSPKNFHLPFTAKLCFTCSNNMAEYEACILGLEEAIELKIKILEVLGDSALVIHQIRENQMADALVTLASMYKLIWPNHQPNVEIRRFNEPAHCLTTTEESNDKPWFFDIKHYREKQEYLVEASSLDKRIIRRLASKLFLNGDVLYKRNYDMVLLICIDKHEANQLMKDIHKGSFGTHANGHATTKKVPRAGYY